VTTDHIVLNKYEYFDKSLKKVNSHIRRLKNYKNLQNYLCVLILESEAYILTP